jgi:hypothetical protein
VVLSFLTVQDLDWRLRSLPVDLFFSSVGRLGTLLAAVFLFFLSPAWLGFTHERS